MKTKSNTKTNVTIVPKPRGGIINLLISILRSLGNIFNKFTPFIWSLQIYFTIRGMIKSFFTSFRIIRESFEFLNRLPVFQLMRKIIRILSIISLIFNIAIFSIFTQFSPILFITSIPGISQVGAFVYESSPEKAQGFILWISLKIKIFLLWLWSGILDFLKAIIKSVLGEIDNLPNKDTIVPDKGKYGDIHNDDYLSKIKESIYDWRFWILGGVIIIGIGVASYLYWDSISSVWRRGGDDPDEPFAPLPIPEIPRTPSPMPSVDSDSSGNSFNRFFRKGIFEKVSQYKEKVRDYFKPKTTSTLIEPNFPRGVYQVEGRDMYLGLPLPRVETLPNGLEYYVSLDKDGFLKYLSNDYTDGGRISIVNPFTGNATHAIPTTINERVSLINLARTNCIHEAPNGSFSLNPNFDGIDMTSMSTPSSSTSQIVDLFDKGKGQSIITDPDATPRAGPSRLPDNQDYDLGSNPFD